MRTTNQKKQNRLAVICLLTVTLSVLSFLNIGLNSLNVIDNAYSQRSDLNPENSLNAQDLSLSPLLLLHD